MEPVVITRRVQLDLSAADLWERVSRASGLEGWLADRADVDLRPGGSGSMRDGDVTRDMRVTAITPDRRVEFTWWDRDDPSTPSHVTLEVERVDDATLRLMITETLLGHGSQRADATADASLAWEV
ncbi:MAG TPA: SRPBCC domain-containing protein, partial [Ilumatobacteraceae bacterium]